VRVLCSSSLSLRHFSSLLLCLLASDAVSRIQHKVLKEVKGLQQVAAKLVDTYEDKDGGRKQASHVLCFVHVCVSRLSCSGCALIFLYNFFL